MKKTCRCYRCNKKLDMLDEQLNFTINCTPTYGSKYDGMNLNIQLCCDCFDSVIDKLVLDRTGGEIK